VRRQVAGVRCASTFTSSHITLDKVVGYQGRRPGER